MPFAIVQAAVVAALLGSFASTADAQSVESDPATGIAVPPLPQGGFRLPDVPDAVLEQIHQDSRFVSLRIGLAPMFDYTFFTQDARSLAQVGAQPDQFEVRSGRVMARGEIRTPRAISYLISFEYKGFDRDPGDPNWAFTDVNFTIPISARVGSLTFGKTKEPFSYEMVGDAANLPQSERVLSPFFKSRNIGATLHNTWLGQRATWAIGWYNDWWVAGDAFSESGHDAAARVTAVPIWSDNSSRYLHLGAAVRYYSGDKHQIKYQGRPETNVSDLYLDTGVLAADHAWHSGLELLWADRTYSVVAEYIRADVAATTVPAPSFHGFYVTGSYILRGRVRPYDRRVGYARRPPIGHRWGHVELVGRYSHVDVTDAGVDGGVLDKWTAGVSWWPNRRFRYTVSYGDADLDRQQVTGRTKMTLLRVQWIY